MIKFSIIIPFYNSKYSLLKTIDSIFNQKISNSDLEVILINDASSDNSLNIVNQFITKHNNISLYTNEINLKQGACRNRGITLAKGKYIWLVDSDDYIENKSLIKLLNIISQKEYDIYYLTPMKFMVILKKDLIFIKKQLLIFLA
jgi:glycosyltransferase involved in cell wall biosynthesis